jgi:hypothetical protein
MLDLSYVYLAAGFAGKDGMTIANIARMHETNQNRHDDHQLEKYSNDASCRCELHAIASSPSIHHKPL